MTASIDTDEDRAMMLAFVLIAGSLATGAAVLLLLPLMRPRADARPVAALAAGGVLIVLLLGGGGLYAAFSNYSWVETPVTRLIRRRRWRRGSRRGWRRNRTTSKAGCMLGRTYTTLEQFPLAVRAYQRADRLANGQNAEAIIGVAESLLAQDFEQMRGAAGQLFDRALELEPDNPKALLYSAFAALSRGEQATARERFRHLLTLNPPPQIRDIVEQAAGCARQRGGGAPGSFIGGGVTRRSSADRGGARHAGAFACKQGARRRARCSSRRATRSRRARRLRSSGFPRSFPVDVELSAADAMLETRRITAGQQLEIVARVALGGTPTATSGDPFGQVSYHVGKDGKLNIVIDRLAP